ncbi:MAG: VWA domain-containing protein [Vicinamibacterales bacterium]
MRSLAVAAVAAALVAVPHGQQRPAFSSGVNLVEVYAAVVDSKGMPVAGLTREDFSVYEDGRPQTIGAFAEGRFPLSVAVAIDRSFSMAKALPVAKSAARTFLGALDRDDQSMLVAIGSDVDTLGALSTDRAAQFEAIDRLRPWGTTGLYDAVTRTIDTIESARGRRALILLSDGVDRYSTASEDQALEHARGSDAMIYPVAIGDAAPFFTRLALLTGGRAFHAGNPAEALAAMHAIADELHHQYLLGYVPSRPIVAGRTEWRAISVRVRRPDVTVRTREGYLAQ